MSDLKFTLKSVERFNAGTRQPQSTAATQRASPKRRQRTGILAAPNEMLSFRSMVRVRAQDRLYRGKVTMVEIVQGERGTSVILHFWDGTAQRL